MKDKKNGLAVGLLVAVLLFSCETFYPDPLDPRLPVYSESGNQQAGALVNNVPFVDYPRVFFYPGSVSVSHVTVFGRDSVFVHLELIRRDNSNLGFSVMFELTDLDERDWEEMKKGFGKKFPLDNPSIKVRIPSGDYLDYAHLQTIKGQITLKVLTEQKIMAGTFGFEANGPDGTNYRVHFGRFDYTYLFVQL